MLIGRKKELESLNNAYNSSRAEFVIVYGRRRVGKTYLVQQAFNGNFAFRVTGLFKKNKRRQLENFTNALAEYSGYDMDIPKDWYEAFRLLKKYLQSLDLERKVVFIDELPWMATAKSDFVGALESFWNGWGANEDSLKLIVCGSASSWFSENVFNDKGGLFNRDTMRIYLKAFSLRETEDFFVYQGITLSRYEIIECYMILGGIPYYLRKLNKSLSLSQNIDMLFFHPKALLFDEFTHLYDALFNKSEDYVRIVQALSAKRSGLTQKEILANIGMQQSGNFSKMLDNLIVSDIISKITTYGARQKEERYVLTDFYTIFYFRFIKGNNSMDSAFWTNRLDSPSLDALRGLSFERVCLLHLNEIKAKLGITGVATETYSFEKKSCGENDKGAQIDLIIDRRDQIINVCECKYSRNVFTIDKNYHNTLKNKVDKFKEFSKTRKAVHTTMITTFGLGNSMYDNSVESVITADDLFAINSNLYLK